MEIKKDKGKYGEGRRRNYTYIHTYIHTNIQYKSPADIDEDESLLLNNSHLTFLFFLNFNLYTALSKLICN